MALVQHQCADGSSCGFFKAVREPKRHETRCKVTCNEVGQALDALNLSDTRVTSLEARLAHLIRPPRAPSFSPTQLTPLQLARARQTVAAANRHRLVLNNATNNP